MKDNSYQDLFSFLKPNNKKKEKEVNYKKEGFGNNIQGLNSLINNNQTKNSLDKKNIRSDNKNNNNKNIEADKTESNIQMSIAKNKHCCIGTDRGFRSCIEIGDADKCMSGDIFPTHEICINPSLRP